MHDIIDVIKNLETLTVNDSAFKVLKDFERVVDELDLYVFPNWENGELVTGPEISRYTVTCKFMWPYENMPDPDGGARLTDYGCKVGYKKDHVLIPRKIYTPDDFRPGTKKGKIDHKDVWMVRISMPKKLMSDINRGYRNLGSNKVEDILNKQGVVVSQPDAAEAQVQDMANAEQPTA
jgi:hypothetical protein